MATRKDKVLALSGSYAEAELCVVVTRGLRDQHPAPHHGEVDPSGLDPFGNIKSGWLGKPKRCSFSGR